MYMNIEKPWKTYVHTYESIFYAYYTYKTSFYDCGTWQDPRLRAAQPSRPAVWAPRVSGGDTERVGETNLWFTRYIWFVYIQDWENKNIYE